MSESRKPLLIGSFLLSGLFLLVVGTLLLSRDSWFSQPSEYVVYFKGALDGLDVGADVTYRGSRSAACAKSACPTTATSRMW